MRKRNAILSLAILTLLPLSSCGTKMTGRITFDLNGGSFQDPNFSTTYLEGESGTPVLIDIPNPVLDGYYFVGWREKDSSGNYREINKRTHTDGNEYYFYPYVDDTFYAYFEPLVSISFDLTEGTSRSGEIIEPLLDKGSFNDLKLQGYASKSIPSLDYLPTAKATNLTFSEWCLKYPLKKEEENGVVHYSLDKTQEEGLYSFRDSFKNVSGNMSFLLDESITLYATWVEDPTIRIHYNIDGILDNSFQTKGSIEEKLIQIIKDTIGVDFSVESARYYYKKDDIDLRFAGFFLDSNFKSQYYLSSSSFDKDLDLYLKWEKKISLTLDYNGGLVDDKATDSFSYYENDILGEDFALAHTPVKAENSFTHYSLNGVEFDLVADKLPGENITLIAQYKEHPTLTLHYDLPSGYTSELTDTTKKIEPFKDITQILNDFKSAITDTTLKINNFYTKNSAGESHIFLDSQMPEENLDLYLEVNYKSEIIFNVYQENSDHSYTLSTDPAFSLAPLYKSNGEAPLQEEEVKKHFEEIKDQNGVTFLLDSIYNDAELTNRATFPIFLEESHTSRPICNLHIKMSKAILLTFVEEDNAQVGQVYVLPGRNLRDYEEKISNAIGAYSNLYVVDGENRQLLVSTLPSNDTTIVVER